MTADEEKLKGGVAVITGAGAGIGSGIARRVGALGMRVVVTDINLAEAQAVAAEIERAGGRAEALEVDVSEPAQLEALAGDVFARHGAVRLLVNNAGIETLGYAWEISAARWEATLNINVHGVVHGVRAFLPRMLAAGAECWVANLSSIGAFGMMPTQSAYIMSKHAVQAFTECLYLEVQIAGAPVHVAAVIPGMLKTAIFDPVAATAPAAHQEPDAGSRLRSTMHDAMAAHGMDLDEGCRIIVEGIAAGKFWCDTQPAMTAASVEGRIRYMGVTKTPELAEAAKPLLG